MAKAKKNPATLEFRTPPERMGEILREQKAAVRSFADKIERGEPLDELGREWVALILREHASKIPDSPSRQRGRKSELSPGDVVLEYMALRRGGEKHDVAIEMLRQKHGGSRTAISEIVRKNKDAADNLIRVLGPPV